MKESFTLRRGVTVLLATMLAVAFAAICLINLQAAPGFYDSDMYTDIRYAMECWTHKSIFPEGWIFGNQLYAVSTPVLAAVFYGLTGNPGLAMGLASTVMALAVVLSFDWMIRPVIRDVNSRLLGAVLFLMLPLFFGDAYRSINGWQLLFTMCSYYACYAVAAFLAYGCYLRSVEGKRVLPWLIPACILAFGTGIQSLRQTAVMTLPLIAVEMLRLMWLILGKQKPEKGPVFTAGALAVCNLAGLIYARVADMEQIEIFGQIGINTVGDMVSSVPGSILTALELVMNYDLPGILTLGCLGLMAVAAVGLILFRGIKHREGKVLVLLMLLTFSVLAIAAVDILTTMGVRSIYYFMLYPLLAFLSAWLFSRDFRMVKPLLVGFLTVLFVAAAVQQLPEPMERVQNREKDPACQISRYMEENGYTIVYSSWNQASDIPAASGWKIQAAFWEYAQDPYFYYNYLCNPQVFRADNSRCVYLLRGEEQVTVSVAKAAEMGISMEELIYFADSDTYLYAASENILEKLQ